MPPPPPPDLVHDAISEILLRLPPDEPQWLFRAALVCKSWLRTLTGPAFLRRYRDFHGAPPLLSLVNGEKAIKTGQGRRFIPTTAVPAFLIPESDDTPYAWPFDCRHGRVLLGMYRSACYLVYDPVTGDRRRVPEQAIGIQWMLMFRSATAVFCAAAGCDHLDCHGGPFCLVCVFTDYTRPTTTMSVTMYSSEIGVWSAPVTLDNVPYVPYSRGPLIGDEIYFALLEAATIVKYDWANNSLSVVKPQPPAMHDGFVLMEMEDHSLGLAGIEDSTLHLWSRRVSLEGIAEWVQCRVIDLEKKMPMANPSDSASVVGFAEGVDIIFVSTGVGLFLMELKSGRVRKVSEPGCFFKILPYMRFYTPGIVLTLAYPLAFFIFAASIYLLSWFWLVNQLLIAI